MQQPIASLEAAIGYVLDLAWYLDISYAELLDGASQLLVLNSVLALIKPVATAAAKATPVLTRLLTQAKHDQVGAIGFGDCVPGELEGALAKVGQTAEEVMGATELWWGGRGLNDADMGVLGRMLEKNATLQTLNLYGNQVGDAGAASLASALEKNATLQTLYLDYNQVGDAGAASLASALEKNATLQKLNLGYNQVGDAGAASLVSALEKKRVEL